MLRKTNSRKSTQQSLHILERATDLIAANSSLELKNGHAELPDLRPEPTLVAAKIINWLVQAKAKTIADMH